MRTSSIFEALQTERAREAQPEPLSGEISSSRKLLEDPYAYLDDTGGFSALAGPLGDAPSRSLPTAHRAGPTDRSSTGNKTPISYSDREIEAKVRAIHGRIWRDRASIWDDAVPSDPVDMLDPAVALALIGYQCHVDEGLGQYRATGGLIEVAGLIDRESRTVRVSRQFPASVRTFTMAHELGHAVLHPSSGGVHRDRPLDGTSLSRERTELEADKFATHFLMPAKLVRSLFLTFFGEAPFVLNEETSFALSGCSLLELQQKCKTPRDLSRLLASAESYDGRHFDSLAARFRVSTEALAIRLEELGLLAA